MDENCTAKNVFNAQPIGTQRKDRLNLRRTDGLEKDLLVSRTKNWRTLARRWLVFRWPRLALGCRATEKRRKEVFIANVVD
ncbi:hypothetical protein TNCV_4210331 [Trichonephila clavipes]|nr:hypothetical protein TNCV_4210331 [Trichonephila clavipes]